MPGGDCQVKQSAPAILIAGFFLPCRALACLIQALAKSPFLRFSHVPEMNFPQRDD
ncbi:hypothetical protein [Pseudomonas saponiphila]|uniref:hypothetical protein n=1 Tax=Pseudomonas saponiphila TaxID=556534 RepID=UPI001428CD65|nr:hypothetical protein [Pseudomonas saponiphila]